MAARGDTSVASTLKIPLDPILVRLLESPHHRGGRSDTVIHDARGFQKTYAELLGDVVQTANSLRKALPPSAFDRQGLLRQDSPYVSVLVRSGYEFIVAFFAIRCLGGACMPIASGILVEEAHYLISKAKAICLLAGDGCHDTAAEICVSDKKPQGGHRPPWHAISNSTRYSSRGGRGIELELDPDLPLDPRSPGLLLFTSGTTGLPKGVVLPRACFAASASGRGRTGGGIAVAGAAGLVNGLLEGATLHVLLETASAGDVLDAVMRHRPSRMSFTPTMLRGVKEAVLARGDPPESYADGFRGLGALNNTSAPLDPSLRDWWVRATGLPIRNRYAATEAGGGISFGGRRCGSIGTPLPGCEVKVSGVQGGEILVKTPGMFIGYVSATPGLFPSRKLKTGDTAEVIDGHVFFAGRAAADYISFRFYRIPALTVEAAILALPYVRDACVLGVPFHESKQLCGAVVKVRRNGPQGEVGLERVRADLGGVVPKYMLPVVLRVVAEDEQIPRTHSGKPIKKWILCELLSTKEWFVADEVPKGVEYCGCDDPSSAGENRARNPWDYGGMQRAL
ncbi:hypothetical protein B0H67DRAFT_640675 [Lasiosphaeris hirsuta]|uniref:AMP-dependent synthetase/ligase domain-containing protein n=1 Tax=Lasiosphaeris hirsuta TaxID=260670 RepID=A0AA40E3W6_9PEZI|nr:hypothetical protein B0H67DRAFT_640675 [Lasiosphaeris hirsuta]